MESGSTARKKIADDVDMPKAKKVKIDEFEDVSALWSNNTASDNASVHGVISKLSPMKKGRNATYYEGSLSDGQQDVRIFGFQERQQKRLLKFNESKDPVSITNCAVKRSAYDDKLEIQIKQYTGIDNSTKCFDVESNDKVITLDLLEDTDDRQLVTVLNVTVSGVELPTELPGGSVKQDVYITDDTGKAHLTFWEDSIGVAEEGVVYSLHDVMVRTYDQVKYLSFARGAVIKIAGNVPKEELNMTNCEVIGVVDLNVYHKCISCHMKVELSHGEKLNFGSCVKCNMKQQVRHCEIHAAAKLVVFNGVIQKTFNASGRVLAAICEVTSTEEVTEEILLSSKSFTMIYKDNTIINIHRK